MLKGIPNIISPKLLMVLDEMGHGDEICIGDGNFPGNTMCDYVIRLDGHGVPEILDAILQLVPLDTQVEHPLTLMAVSPNDPTPTPKIWKEFKKIAAKYDDRGAKAFEEIDRFAFYDRVKTKSYCCVMSGETAVYANVIIKKGVVK